MWRQERYRDCEAGFTLVELLIVMSLLSIVMAVMLSTLFSVQRSETYTRGRTEALDEMRAAVNRMTKDLRQTSATVGTYTASSLTVTTYVDGEEATVSFNATGDTLTRSVNGGTPYPLVDDLTTTDIFTYTPTDSDPNMVGVLLSVQPPALPDTILNLEAEIEFRNG